MVMPGQSFRRAGRVWRRVDLEQKFYKRGKSKDAPIDVIYNVPFGHVWNDSNFSLGAQIIIIWMTLSLCLF